MKLVSPDTYYMGTTVVGTLKYELSRCHHNAKPSLTQSVET